MEKSYFAISSGTQRPFYLDIQGQILSEIDKLKFGQCFGVLHMCNQGKQQAREVSIDLCGHQ